MSPVGLGWGMCPIYNISPKVDKAIAGPRANLLTPEQFDFERVKAVAEVVRKVDNDTMNVLTISPFTWNVRIGRQNDIKSTGFIPLARVKWTADEESLINTLDPSLFDVFDPEHRIFKFKRFRTTGWRQELADDLNTMAMRVASEPLATSEGHGCVFLTHVFSGSSHYGLTNSEIEGGSDFSGKDLFTVRNRQLLYEEELYNAMCDLHEWLYEQKKKNPNFEIEEIYFHENRAIPWAKYCSDTHLTSVIGEQRCPSIHMWVRYKGMENRSVEDLRDENSEYQLASYIGGYGKSVERDRIVEYYAERGSVTRDGRHGFSYNETIVPCLRPGITTPLGMNIFELFRDMDKRFVNYLIRYPEREIHQTCLSGIAWNGPFYGPRHLKGYRVCVFVLFKDNDIISGKKAAPEKIEVPFIIDSKTIIPGDKESFEKARLLCPDGSPSNPLTIVRKEDGCFHAMDQLLTVEIEREGKDPHGKTILIKNPLITLARQEIAEYNKLMEKTAAPIIGPSGVGFFSVGSYVSSELQGVLPGIQVLFFLSQVTDFFEKHPECMHLDFLATQDWSPDHLYHGLGRPIPALRNHYSFRWMFTGKIWVGDSTNTAASVVDFRRELAKPSHGSEGDVNRFGIHPFEHWTLAEAEIADRKNQPIDPWFILGVRRGLSTSEDLVRAHLRAVDKLAATPIDSGTKLRYMEKLEDCRDVVESEMRSQH